MTLSEALAAEIERRMLAIERGEVKTVDRATAMENARRLFAELHSCETP